MKAQKRKTVWIAAAVVAVLAVLLAVSAWLMSTHVLVSGKLYPKRGRQVDLRGKTVTEAEVRDIYARFPGYTVQWNIPFQGGTLPSGSTEVTVTSLTEEDVRMLGYLTGQVTVHGENCRDYDGLLALSQAHPSWNVLYRVTVDGTVYDQDTQAVELHTLTREEAALLSYLPQLKTVDGSRCRNYGLLNELRQENPSWEVRYTVKLGDSELDPDAESGEATGAEYSQIAEALAGLPKLKKLTLTDPKADGRALLELAKKYPGLDLSWSLNLNGQSVPMDAEEVDISGMDLESLDQAKAIAESFPKLTKLIMSDCTVDGNAIRNEDMAALRDQLRERCKVVWTVYCGDVVARTDDTWFMPIQQGEYYFQEEDAYNLRYCEDMVCIDVGHSRISTVEFAAYMPHLKYLILTDTAVMHIDELENCKELIYLELTFGIVRSYEPLLGCTALEDLNLEMLYYTPDPSPIFKMTWLKNVFWKGCNSKTRRMAEEALPDTNLVFTAKSSSSGEGWRNLKNYYDMRDILGMPYMR